MTMVNLFEAKTKLSQLVARAANGEDVIIAKAGRPLARLTALPDTKASEARGRYKAAIEIADNFDDPLPIEIAATFGEQ